MKRTSPGSMSPDASFTISPGTMSSMSTSMTLPFRITSILLLIIFCSFCAAEFDFSVCTKEMIEEIATTNTSIRNVAQLGSSAIITSVISVTTETMRSTMLKGLMIASLIRIASPLLLPVSMIFLPYSSRRSLAST